MLNGTTAGCKEIKKISQVAFWDKLDVLYGTVGHQEVQNNVYTIHVYLNDKINASDEYILPAQKKIHVTNYY